MNRGPNEWFKPTTLLSIIGFLSLGWSSYMQFQRDSAKDLAVLEQRVKVLEVQMEFYSRAVKP